jgi:Tfp pilus assembly protein FimT
VAILLVVGAIGIPALKAGLQSMATASDARAVAAQLALAKMRAAANFTDARVNFNSFTQNSATGTYQYQVEVYNQGTATWAIDQTGGKNTGVQNLSTYTSYGFSNITTPAGSQASIAQSNLIEFNSRGIPVTSALVATGSYAVYLNNGNGTYYAVTVSISGNIQIWQMNGTASTWTQFY